MKTSGPCLLQRTLSAFGMTALLATLLAAAPACAQFTTTAPKSFTPPLKKMTPPTASATSSAKAVAAPQANRIDTLDVIGLGFSVEMFRQGKVWEEMQKHPTGSLLPTDPTKYPWSNMEKRLVSDKRDADVLEAGASYFPENWHIPSVSVWSALESPRWSPRSQPEPSMWDDQPPGDFMSWRINALRAPAGMHHHKIKQLAEVFDNNPDFVLEQAFQFFELNPEVPTLLICMFGERSGGDRDRQASDMSETNACFLLARRERVEAMRAYLPPASVANQNHRFFTWRDKQAATAVKPAAAPAPFKPSKYLDKPWTTEQFEWFDALPTLGKLHRPITVSYWKDAQRKHKMSDAEQQAAFKAAFDLAMLPAGAAAARVFYDAGGPKTGRHIVPLSLAVNASLPQFDLFDPKKGVDLFKRMGDAGAASPFAQWALGVTAAYRNNDASLAVHLRPDDRATITLITPSGDKRRYPGGFW